MKPSPVAVCYLRQSKTDAAELASGQSLSSDAQMARCAAYCALHGFTLDEATSRASTDLDTSAKAQARGRRVKDRWKRRPGLSRLYEIAETGAYQHLICYDLSRLVRDVPELFEIRDAFAERGVTVHLASEGIRTDSDIGELIVGILGSVYQMESRNQSRRFRDAWQQKADSGLPHGKAPAWVVTDKTKGLRDPERYSLHPERAAAMRRLVELRLLGIPYHRIADHLAAEGHTRMDGQRWMTANVYDCLTPERRLLLIGSQMFTGSSGRPVLLSGVFPAIITEEEYAALSVVQETIAASRYHPTGMPNAARQETSFLAAGLLHCGYCGRRMKTATSATVYRQYTCLDAYNTGIAHTSLRPGAVRNDRAVSYSIGRDKIDSSVMDALAEIALRYPASSLPPPRKAAKPKHRRTVEEIDREADYLYEQRRDGKLSQRDYDRRYGKLLEEREALEKAREEESGQDAVRHAITALRGLSESHDPAQARLVLRLLTERIECPVPITGERPTASGNARMGLRIVFKRPMPDGTTSITVGVYRAMYRGLRYAEWGYNA